MSNLRDFIKIDIYDTQCVVRIVDVPLINIKDLFNLVIEFYRYKHTFNVTKNQGEVVFIFEYTPYSNSDSVKNYVDKVVSKVVDVVESARMWNNPLFPPKQIGKFTFNDSSEYVTYSIGYIENRVEEVIRLVGEHNDNNKLSYLYYMGYILIVCLSTQKDILKNLIEKHINVAELNEEVDTVSNTEEKKQTNVLFLNGDNIPEDEHSDIEVNEYADIIVASYALLDVIQGLRSSGYHNKIIITKIDGDLVVRIMR